MGRSAHGVLSPYSSKVQVCSATFVADQCARAQEQNVHRFLLAPDLLADIVDVAYQARVCGDEKVLPFGIGLSTFRCDSIGGLLGASDNVDSWFTGMLGELLQRVFPDSAGATDEDGDEACWKR